MTSATARSIWEDPPQHTMQAHFTWTQANNSETSTLAKLSDEWTEMNGDLSPTSGVESFTPVIYTFFFSYISTVWIESEVSTTSLTHPHIICITHKYVNTQSDHDINDTV